MKGQYFDQKVLLLLPNSWESGKRRWTAIPHASLILTALLKNEFNFSILDAFGLDLGEDQCKSVLMDINPSIVLVSALSVEYWERYHKAVAVAKSACPEAVTVVGGVYPTVIGDHVIKDNNVDYIFVGHAEERVNHFLRLILDGDHESVRALPGIGFRNQDGAIVINPVSTYIGDVKRLTDPDYSLLDLSPYLERGIKEYQFNSENVSTDIITSYGCPYNCLFCATRTISGRRIAYRSAESVLQEIDFLIRKYGIRELTFLDDHFVGEPRRIQLILNGLVERNYDLTWKCAQIALWSLDDKLLELMKLSGCSQLSFSVESGSPRVLKDIIRKPLKLTMVPPIVKKCKELGIDLGANFVIGLPGETWDEIRETFRFAEECDFDLVHFHIATPQPATDLYKICKEKGYLPNDFSFFDPKFFGFGKGFIQTQEFTPFELEVLRAFEWDRINFNRPDKIFKIARLYKLSLEELNDHRKQTRLKLGIHF